MYRRPPSPPLPCLQVLMMDVVVLMMVVLSYCKGPGLGAELRDAVPKEVRVVKVVDPRGAGLSFPMQTPGGCLPQGCQNVVGFLGMRLLL